LAFIGCKTFERLKYFSSAAMQERSQKKEPLQLSLEAVRHTF